MLARPRRSEDCSRSVPMADVLDNVLVTGGDREQDAEQELGGLLKRCRARIVPERASLGPYLRAPMRVGKHVTQEEVAETIDISRQWYALLESNRRVRVSATVLGRIADALLMDTTERSELFRLAVPELRSLSLADRSAAMLDAFTPLRNFTRAMWAATTESEALTLLREHAMAYLAPDYAATCVRLEDGSWQFVLTGEAPAADERKAFLAQMRERYGPAIIDDLHGYPLLAQPGELVTRAELDALFPGHAARARPTMKAFNRADISIAITSIRSQNGLVVRLVAFHYTAHLYSEMERAQLSTLADITSLALSGRLASAKAR
jgi:transcriptional regulator with XRE-family HTH domain